MIKIPFTRLKVAQIEREHLHREIFLYCETNRDFQEFIWNDTFAANEFFVVSNVFNEMRLDTSCPEDLLPKLNELHKQFCSFQYLMIT